ncbi:MAG: hypothetical protein ABH889_00735 [Candidatus Portnoybacteria bacterium]
MTVSKEKQEKYRKFRDEFITFEDILFLALVYTSIRQFSSDTMDWHRAVYEICQKYRESVPELKSIYFDHGRPPLPPMADQVYGLQTLLMMCRELEGLDTLSAGHILRIPKGVRPKIRRDEERRLPKYLEQIRDMGKIFDKHLKIKKRRY